MSKNGLSKKEGKDQESIQSSTTPDPGYQLESDIHTIRHNKREPRVSPYPAGDHKASINRCARKHNKHKTEITQMIHKRSTALERSVKYSTGRLKLVSWLQPHRTLSSDVDQDTEMFGLHERTLTYPCIIS